MRNIIKLVRELTNIAREGTIIGTLRYIRFKRSGSSTNKAALVSNRMDGGVAILGAGTYAASIHLPCLRAHGIHLYALMSRTLCTAMRLARVYRMAKVYENLDMMLADDRCDSLLIVTPHYLHPPQILKALEFGRYTYCEKPVAIDQEGLDCLIREGLAHAHADRIMIGFNRRFAPAIRKLRQISWLAERQMPMEIHYRVNFGPRVKNMLSDPVTGGGRIHGAACHYVDLIAFLVGAPITRVMGVSISSEEGADENTFSACMQLADGSVAGLTFTSEGSRGFDLKEEIAITCSGHVARVVDFAKLRVDGQSYRFYRHRYGAMDAIGAFLSAKEASSSVPVSLKDGIAATQVTLAIQKSIQREGEGVNVPHTLSPMKGVCC